MNWRIGVLLSFLFTLQLKKSEAINQTYSNIVKGLEIGNCEPGYYGFPYCTLCACDPVGSVNQTCDSNGWCTCAPRFNGPKCNHCSAGYYNFPKCEACNCDPAGSYGVTCQNGVCQCRDNFEGIKCDKCKKNFYNFPICESCSCNPAGVVPNFTSSLNGLDACDGESGQCAYEGPETDDIRENVLMVFMLLPLGTISAVFHVTVILEALGVVLVTHERVYVSVDSELQVYDVTVHKKLTIITQLTSIFMNSKMVITFIMIIMRPFFQVSLGKVMPNSLTSRKR
ncbi:laminin-like protein epi-1 [Panonychus citri]|uniref:laminin-like protein epi-1 n=1 Tax=Panonychus citri TaxID=50023 RepID=UPI002307092F|nr:laminin-like protein epi-1 [Panonychus citri]